MPPEAPQNPPTPGGEAPKPAAAAPAAASAPAPVAPKPAAPAPVADDVSRRNFLGIVSWNALGWAAFTAASGASGIATARFMFPNVNYEKPSTVKVGKPDEYTEVDSVYEQYKDTDGVWIVREKESISALITVCTHLGCTPNWLPNEGKIKCPCHGSGFRPNGINFEGPAPRPLERAKIVMLDDGSLLVDKSRKFQQEKGEWADPDSFVPVTA